MPRLRSSLLLVALAAALSLPTAFGVHAQDVRDGAGNIIIRGDIAAARGMVPFKPLFTQSVDPNGNYVAPGGGGGSGSTGSVTAPGTNGTQAQAVQGINGGVPQNVTQVPTSAISVQRTTAIGTTGTLVSASDTTNRRTVTNTSTLACELMGSAAAYGTGYPLPAGGSFTFDASGRTTGAIYVACASAGGTAAVLSY